MQLANSSGINYRQYMNEPTMSYYFKLVFSNSQNFCITLLCTAKEAFVKQTAFTNILHTEVGIPSDF